MSKRFEGKVVVVNTLNVDLIGKFRIEENGDKVIESPMNAIPVESAPGKLSFDCRGIDPLGHVPEITIGFYTRIYEAPKQYVDMWNQFVEKSKMANSNIIQPTAAQARQILRG